MNSETELNKKLSDFLTIKNTLIVFIAIVTIGAALYIFSNYSASIALIAIPLLIVGTLIYTSYSISKIYSSDSPARDYIPPEDRKELVKLIDKSENPKEALEIFKQFVSLYGFTGNITKLGLSGLPLLTAALTIFFTILAASIWFIGVWLQGAGASLHGAGAALHGASASLPGATASLPGAAASLSGAAAASQGTGTSSQGTGDLHDIITALMDLAKLTLGAFIGSFVQRNISEPASQKPSPPNGQDK